MRKFCACLPLVFLALALLVGSAACPPQPGMIWDVHNWDEANWQ